MQAFCRGYFFQLSWRVFMEKDVLLKQKVEGLDLEPIVVKLMDPVEGKGWSLEKALATTSEYRKFLFLVGLAMQTNDSEPVVPWGGVDEVWHTHILDTEKYHQDCEQLFGRFLHHFPYYGMRGETDRNNLVDSARRTLEKVLMHFGEFLDDMVPQRGMPLTCTGKWCGGTLVTDNAKIRSTERPHLAQFG